MQSENPADVERQRCESSSSKEQAKEVDPLLGDKELPTGCYEWFVDLGETIGWRFLFLLFTVQHLMRGFVDNFSIQGKSYLLKLYNVPATSVQIYGAVIMLPWAMKPIVGLCSDVQPFMGFHKAPYMLFFSFLGALSCLVVGIVPTNVLPLAVVVIGLTLLNMQLATNDILTEAKYAEKIREFPRHGPHILTFVWFGMNLGGLVAVLLSGWVIGTFGCKLIFTICAIPAAACMVPVMLNYLDEKKTTASELDQRREQFMSQAEACVLCVAMLASVITMMLTATLSQNVNTNFVVALVVFFSMLFMFSVFLSPKIAMFNAFSFIQASLSVQVSGASFYFMTDTPEQYPNGPHFTPFFFNSVVGSVGQAVSLLGIVIYARYMTRFSYRTLLIVANVALIVLQSLDSLLYARVNKSLGIPDHVFLVGFTAMQNVVSQWQWMPQVVILSYLCPKNMEATMYALLAGCHNVGNSLAANFGAMLLHVYHVNPTGSDNEGGQFDNLWRASLVSSVLPLIPICLMFRMVPDIKQGDKVLEDECDATSGSLWKQWTKTN